VPSLLHSPTSAFTVMQQQQQQPRTPPPQEVYQVSWRCKLLSDYVGRIRNPGPGINPNYTMQKDTHVYITGVQVANLTGQNLLPTPENTLYRVQQLVTFPSFAGDGVSIGTKGWRISHANLSAQRGGVPGPVVWRLNSIVYVIIETSFTSPGGGQGVLKVGTRLIIMSEPSTQTGGHVKQDTTRPNRAFYTVQHAKETNRTFECISPPYGLIPHSHLVYDP